MTKTGDYQFRKTNAHDGISTNNKKEREKKNAIIEEF